MGSNESLLDEIVRASTIVASKPDLKAIVTSLVDQAIDVTASDLCAAYLYADPSAPGREVRLCLQRGEYEPPKRVSLDENETFAFALESGESVVVLGPGKRYFRDAILDPRMTSALVIPLAAPDASIGFLVLNAREADHYGRTRLSFAEAFARIASGTVRNARLLDDLKAYVRQIEELQRYQENIFSSMTNLLITTEQDGKIRYLNDAAKERLGLADADLGKELGALLGPHVDPGIASAIEEARTAKHGLYELEGIWTDPRGDIDFSMSVSPLKARGGSVSGLTIIMADQTKERELEKEFHKVKEERRVIKDMFSRYLSREVVKTLVERPSLVKLGGDKKFATIFFADIRGYTAFSEGRDPGYIVEILNEYFSEAVEVIIAHKGYIDKFIGDCIMAAWGVPLQTVEDDAKKAVACALAIQELIKAKNRKFFLGEASHLRVGIGMHSGPLVAGNLGSSRYMNYTVIGDTVNLAARLEGVAAAGEVIITEDTKALLGDSFDIEKRAPVMVQGKSKPIPIFNVRGKG